MNAIIGMGMGMGGGGSGGGMENGNIGSGMGGSVLDKASRRDLSRADVLPMVVDQGINFESVGGLDRHVVSLKELVVLPLLYPDVFCRFDVQPPRGVLFTGPPGTGKTLMARALANSLSTGSADGGQKVSFFMRKGADCLSKWVGEGERQLRLLFEQAKRFEPAIIFFDEIDGLAPVRSVKQDQIHASIVSTLLALMDGLDSRGKVVVIGATNRPDAIDPALRRPGRFDRELLFPLPNASARSAILDINTKTWQPALDSPTKEWIVNNTVGYCGADMKALCAESLLIALRRSYPSIYQSSERLALDVSSVHLGRGDFAAALSRIVPASRRSMQSHALPLNASDRQLLGPMFEAALRKISRTFPPAHKAAQRALVGSQGIPVPSLKPPTTNGVEDPRSQSSECDNNGSGPMQTVSVSLAACASTSTSAPAPGSAPASASALGCRSLDEENDQDAWVAALSDTVSLPYLMTQVDAQLLPRSLEMAPISVSAALKYAELGRKEDGTTAEPSCRLEPVSGSSNVSLVPQTLRESEWQPSSLWDASSLSMKSRILLTGPPGMGQREVAGAVVDALEAFPTLSLNFSSLVGDLSAMSPEQALVLRIQEAQRMAPCLLYFGDIGGWWESATEGLRDTLSSLVASAPSHLSILWLAWVDFDATQEGWERTHLLSASDKRFANLIRWWMNFSSSHQQQASELNQPLGEPSGDYYKEKKKKENSNNNVVEMTCLSRASQLTYWYSFFGELPLLPARLYTAKKQLYEAKINRIELAKEPIAVVATVPKLSHDANWSIGTRGLPEIIEASRTRSGRRFDDAEIDERARNTHREIRVFLRATMAELYKVRNHSHFFFSSFFGFILLRLLCPLSVQ
jgi:SpoVK/Ycf46/Vps4 family AAA+-type ATPase